MLFLFIRDCITSASNLIWYQSLQKLTLSLFLLKTHTQAERKIMEERKDALLREASENGLTGSELQHKLDELDSIKSRPYGTLQAVSNIFSFVYFFEQ